MDGIVLLGEDHKLVKGLFREFERTKHSATPKAKRALLDHIRIELVNHAFIETTVKEHRVMAGLLAELADLHPTDDAFDAKVTLLIDSVRDHIGQEETAAA